MRYRIKYKKEGPAVFISQLDVQRAFQRAFRRANLNTFFSEGFNPHPKMSYGPPPPMYASSSAEYLEVWLIDLLEAIEIKEVLCKEMPKGLEICEVTLIGENETSLSNVLESASYIIALHINDKDCNVLKLCDDLLNAYNSDISLIYNKLNKKKKITQRDIRDGIIAFRCMASADEITIDCTLSLRGDNLLSPSALIEAFTQNFPDLKNAEIKSVEKYKSCLKSEA